MFIANMAGAWKLTGSEELQLPHPAHPEEGHGGLVYTIKLRGSYLVSGSADKTVRVWNADSQRLIRGPLWGHEGSVICLDFDESPDQDVIISGSTDRSILIWQFSTGNAIKRLESAHESTVLSLAFDHRLLVTGSKDTTIKVWNRHSIALPGSELPSYTYASVMETEVPITPYHLLATLKEGHEAVKSVLLDRDITISGSGDRSIAVWNLQTGQLVRKILKHTGGITDLLYDGCCIVSASSDNTCRIYNMQTDTEVACLRGHANIVRSVHLVPGKRSAISGVVTGSFDGTIRHWEPQENGEWECRATLESHGFQTDRTVNSSTGKNSTEDETSRIFEIGLDTKRVAAAGFGPVIKMWRMSTP
ncbi:hypothetical protein PISL3812_09884 [Talaromyces islandicus]|uniref:Mitochondrial division protein 1 n=1 Tax=Talaromyces islandicus TaxID=28573 RepID=A0A0U1MB89_TALIS|nr:hypothetical protein PISL3812_09884 [Talaromyces islandicus]